MREENYRIPFGGGEVNLRLLYAGKDLIAVLYGGDMPHIGCAVVAVPRKSLLGDESISCTSSVINLTGHKDEFICREMAECLCRKHKVTVTCTGGIHLNEAGETQIEDVVRAIRKFCESYRVSSAKQQNISGQ